MSKEKISPSYSLLVLFGLLVLTALATWFGWSPEANAHGHAQMFPHQHPHEVFALVDDFLLNGLWLALWGVIYHGVTGMLRAFGRRARGEF